MNEYDTIDAVNWTTLKWMRESPQMYRYRLSVPIEDTPALALGRATHTLVFEPALFAEEYVIWQGGRRAGKEWDAFADAHSDKTILREQDADMVTQLAEAISRHPLVQPYLDGGEFEWPVTWTDPDTGLTCKARLDWPIPKRRILLDLKTCVSAEAHRFGAAAARLGYHLQMGHYYNACTYGLKWRPEQVLIVAAEKDAPHDVAVFQMSDDDIYLACEEVAELLRKVKVCRQTGVWPGRYLERQALTLPAWVTMDDEEDPEALGLVIGEK